MAVHDQTDSATPERSPRAAIDDPAARRRLRLRWTAVAALVAVGLLLIASNPFLRDVARSRERAFREDAELITAEVVRTDEGMVTVRWYDLDYEYEGDVWVESSGKYDPGDELEVLIDPESETVHLPGSAIDFLGFPLDDVHTFGWLVGVASCGAAVYFGRRAMRMRRLLATYPWRSLDMRWNGLSERLVGTDGAHLVEFECDPPVDDEGELLVQATVEVAGPPAAEVAPWSVMRQPPGASIRFVKGPVPATAPTPASVAAPSWGFPTGRLTAQGSHRRREVSTDQGVTFATITRGVEEISVADSAGQRRLQVRGDEKVRVFDDRGQLLGRIRFRFFPGAAEVFSHEGAKFATIRMKGANKSTATNADGAVIGSAVQTRAMVPSRGAVTVSVAGDLEPGERTLLTLALLTARWQPLRPSGGGA